jgi:CubicO group peptidase (beta-lactamase class C family)
MGMGIGIGMGIGMDEIWQVLDAQVDSGRVPGYVAAVRIGGRTGTRTGGRTALEPGSPPMRPDTLFRIASVTKPMGAALTLSLVQDGVLDLDDPIGRWLPEMAAPRVLRSPSGPLHDTVAAQRPVTVRHLLAATSGWGCVLDETPLQQAMFDRHVFPSAHPPAMTGDEFVRRVAGLPLAFQPGEGWLYDTGVSVCGVLLERATGRSLGELFAERIAGPLGLADTAFQAVDPARMSTAYRPDGDGFALLDPADGAFVHPPPFEAMSGGLVSTAGDVLRFYAAMADGGAPVLTPGSLKVLTAEALAARLRPQAEPITGPGVSWALGTGVDVEAVRPWQAPGRWGWTGGTGTTAHVDPVRGTVAVLLTQRAMTGPQDGFDDFWTAVARSA